MTACEKRACELGPDHGLYGQLYVGHVLRRVQDTKLRWRCVGCTFEVGKEYQNDKQH